MPNQVKGILSVAPENQLRGILGPATANPNMLAQAANARMQNRNMLAGPSTGYEAAQYAGMVPGLGLLGVLGDIGQYMDKPETRNALAYGLTALGAVPFLGAMAKMAGPMPKGILQRQAGAIAYHGSPHKFDQFDASKIGTGEGAQAYGHGLYFAEQPSVARNYMPKPTVVYNVPQLEGKSAVMVGNEIISTHNTAESANKALGKAKAGTLYKADIPDEWLPKMLDWDKPLTQQPKDVQNALKTYKGNDWWIRNRDHLYGKDLVRNQSPQEFSDALKTMGVPGIRYLDQGSRSAGQGTYNYVVFPGMEKQVKILGRE